MKFEDALIKEELNFKTEDKDDEAEKLAKDYETLIEKSIFLYDRMTELKLFKKDR